MAIDVIVPLNLDCPYRKAAWDYVQNKYEHHNIVESYLDGPWCKAKAVNQGARNSTADVVAVVDADCWSDGFDLAIDAIEKGAPWAMPHGKVHRLTKESSEKVKRGTVPNKLQLAQKPYTGVGGGAIVVLPRETLLKYPWDERFIKWGGADKCWARLLKTFTGKPQRIGQPLWHLWHPKQPKTRANRNISKRYKQSMGNKHEMASILEEVRTSNQKEQ